MVFCNASDINQEERYCKHIMSVSNWIPPTQNTKKYSKMNRKINRHARVLKGLQTACCPMMDTNIMTLWSGNILRVTGRCEGNSPVTCEVGDLRRHRVHYDITVMEIPSRKEETASIYKHYLPRVQFITHVRLILHKVTINATFIQQRI